MAKIKPCIDCGSTEKSRQSKRCRSCGYKHRSKNDAWRKNNSEASKRAWREGKYDGIEEKIAEAYKRGAYDKPGMSERRSEIQREIQNRPRIKRIHREVLEKRWADGEFEGVFTSKAHRRKLSKAMIRAHAEGRFDHIYTDESRQKQSEALKQCWKDGVFDGVFQSPTSIELQIAAALDMLSIDHEAQYRPDGYGRTFDEFVMPDVLIEINGDYWHSDEGNPGIKERDAQKAKWAKDNGYHFVTVWEYEIKERGAWSLVIERVLPLLE